MESPPHTTDPGGGAVCISYSPQTGIPTPTGASGCVCRNPAPYILPRGRAACTSSLFSLGSTRPTLYQASNTASTSSFRHVREGVDEGQGTGPGSAGSTGCCTGYHRCWSGRWLCVCPLSTSCQVSPRPNAEDAEQSRPRPQPVFPPRTRPSSANHPSTSPTSSNSKSDALTCTFSQCSFLYNKRLGAFTNIGRNTGIGA